MTSAADSPVAAIPLVTHATALREGAVDLHAQIDAALDRIDRYDARVRAFLPEPGRRARVHAQADALAARFPHPASRPPLYGVLVGVKDIFAVDGLPTRAGSALPPEEFAMAQGPAVTRLVEAGALILGKTVTAEFAGADPGATTNPHDPTRTPGGSSSGSAAAVASGYVALALGTQTVGSTMRPAAFCGVVGFKPSFGRVSTAGMLAFSPSVDHVGWFTQDVAGAHLAAAVLMEDWGEVATPSRSLVLGVPVGPYLAQTEPAALAAFEATLASLIARDVIVRRVPMFDDIATIAGHHRAISLAEFSDVHADRFRRLGSLFRPISAMRFDFGQTVTPEARAAGAASRLALRERLQSAMAAHEIDAWACPSTLGPAPVGLASTGDAAMNLPWTHAGLPSVSVPAGRVADMPVGLQLAGRFGADEALLAAAQSIETLLG